MTMSGQFSLGGFQLDLGNFEKSSNMIMTDRKRIVSNIASEDDGPTDFTLNMEKWMKGTDAYKKDDPEKGQETESQAGEEPIEQPTPASGTHLTIKAGERPAPDPFAREEISGFTGEPLFSNTPSPMCLRRRPTVEDVPNDSAHPLPASAYPRLAEKVIPRAPDSPTPLSRRGSGSSQGPPADILMRSRRSSDPRAPDSPTPLARQGSGSQQAQETQPTSLPLPAPLSRLNTETKQNNAAEEVFSHISALQAEVERLRLENQTIRSTNSSLERDNASYASAYENIEKAYKGLERENEAREHAYQVLERSNAKLQTNFEDLQDRFRIRETASASEIQAAKAQTQERETAAAAEIKAIESQCRDRETAAATEIKALKTQFRDRETALASEAQVASSRLLRKAEVQIRERDTALSSSKREITAAKKELSATKQRLANMEKQLAEVTAAGKAREEEWMGRVELLFREREKMSKALMTEWGKREVGEGKKARDGGQAYRYRYKKVAS